MRLIKNVHGLTISEFLISNSLTLLLVLSLMSSLKSTRENLIAARRIEGTREILQTLYTELERHIRMAGYLGCVASKSLNISPLRVFSDGYHQSGKMAGHPIKSGSQVLNVQHASLTNTRVVQGKGDQITIPYDQGAFNQGDGVLLSDCGMAEPFTIVNVHDRPDKNDRIITINGETSNRHPKNANLYHWMSKWYYLGDTGRTKKGERVYAVFDESGEIAPDIDGFNVVYLKNLRKIIIKLEIHKKLYQHVITIRERLAES